MTITTAPPDLRTASLSRMPDPATLDKLVQRALPAAPAPVPDARRRVKFSSGI